MKREDEELCRSIFDVYLLTLFEREAIKWASVEKRHEPPDFYLELAGNKYAIEVTALIEKMRTGGKRRSPVSQHLTSTKGIGRQS